MGSLGSNFTQLMQQAADALPPNTINESMVGEVAGQFDSLQGLMALGQYVDPITGHIRSLSAGSIILNDQGLRVDGDDTFAVLTGAQTYVGESLSDGDIIIGNSSENQANLFWDKSAGKISFRGGTTEHGHIDTSGSAVFGDGAVSLDTYGISLLTGIETETKKRINWNTAHSGGFTGSYIHTNVTGASPNREGSLALKAVSEGTGNAQLNLWVSNPSISAIANQITFDAQAHGAVLQKVIQSDYTSQLLVTDFTQLFTNGVASSKFGMSHHWNLEASSGLDKAAFIREIRWDDASSGAYSAALVYKTAKAGGSPDDRLELNSSGIDIWGSIHLRGGAGTAKIFTHAANTLELNASGTLIINEDGTTSKLRIETNDEPNFFHINSSANTLQIGDMDTNYTQIAVDGTVTFAGTARMTNAIWIDAGGIKAPGAKPADSTRHGVLETPAWSFGDEAEAEQESVSFSIRIPNRMDRLVAPSISVGWSADGANPGVCEWQLEYLWTAPGEDTGAGAQETLYAYDTAPATADGLVVTAFTGIDVPSATDACLHCKLKRLSAAAAGNSADTIAIDVHLHGICFDWTSDKLGGDT